MPGFVDVSNMSREDIRRMDHAADYDDVDFQPRRKIANSYSTSRPASAKHTISDVWAAACAADRINGGYVKEYVYEWNEVAQINKVAKDKNRNLMMHFLANPAQLLVEDVERGEYCRKFLENDLTFRTLNGKTSEFDNAIRKVLVVKDHFDDHFHKYELAIVACLPQSVERSEIRQNSESRVQFATGGLVGKVGDKVEFNVEVLSANFSKQYNIYWIRAITETDQAVFFSNKESFDLGTHLSIKGTVKAHKDNLTQLNRVKVL